LRSQESILGRIDWLSIFIFLALIISGWLNIYAAVYDEELNQSIFDLSFNSGKQLLFVASTLVLVIFILTIDFKFYDSFAYIIYGVMVFLLLLVLVIGKEVAGATSWIEMGPFSIQPSEFSKFATALALAKYLSETNARLDRLKTISMVVFLIGLPVALVLLQPDTGTALIFGAFIIVLYREGLSSVFILLGLFSIALFVTTLLVPQLYIYVAIVILWASSFRKMNNKIVNAHNDDPP